MVLSDDEASHGPSDSPDMELHIDLSYEPGVPAEKEQDTIAERDGKFSRI